MALLTAARLRKLLRYSPATGKFRWKVHRRGIRIGTVAGSRERKGYYEIRIDGKLHQSSRLAWLYMTGKWPKLEINFINRNSSDTRWANLQEMTPTQRRMNGRRRCKLGVMGVCTTDSGTYVARIRVAGRRKYLGTFDTIKKASAAYSKAAKRAFGEFARAR